MVSYTFSQERWVAWFRQATEGIAKATASRLQYPQMLYKMPLHSPDSQGNALLLAGERRRKAVKQVAETIRRRRSEDEPKEKVEDGDLCGEYKGLWNTIWREDCIRRDIARPCRVIIGQLRLMNPAQDLFRVGSLAALLLSPLTGLLRVDARLLVLSLKYMSISVGCQDASQSCPISGKGRNAIGGIVVRIGRILTLLLVLAQFLALLILIRLTIHQIKSSPSQPPPSPSPVSHSAPDGQICDGSASQGRERDGERSEPGRGEQRRGDGRDEREGRERRDNPSSSLFSPPFASSPARVTWDDIDVEFTNLDLAAIPSWDVELPALVCWVIEFARVEGSE
ncbi:hypothetical protein C8J56DRAFT_899205 [Mycena floridula]|nr:hypothetical protein C8J56DRAFT_899205 [Mycena floridula]